MGKQYLILNPKDMPTTSIIRLEKIKGLFIECPDCGKLARLVKVQNIEKEELPKELK